MKTPSVHTLTSVFFASKTLGLDLDPMEAKSRYGMRDEQEKTFMLQKGPLGEDRLRVCTESSKHGRMFICFVALILASYIRHIRGTKPELTKAFPSMAAILEGMHRARRPPQVHHSVRRRSGDYLRRLWLRNPGRVPSDIHIQEVNQGQAWPPG